MDMKRQIVNLQVAICKTIAVPEEKWAGLLRAEKNRAQASVLQALIRLPKQLFERPNWS